MCIRDRTALKAEGQAILVIDKDINALSRFADHHTVLNKGEVVWSGSNDALKDNTELVESHLHL